MPTPSEDAKIEPNNHNLGKGGARIPRTSIELIKSDKNEEWVCIAFLKPFCQNNPQITEVNKSLFSVHHKKQRERERKRERENKCKKK